MFQAIADRPTHNTAGVKVNHHGQIQPALSDPDISDITYPFLVRSIRIEVPVQPVGRNVEVVISVCGGFVFACSDDANAVVTHQTAHTAMPNHQANLFQLLSHSWAAITPQAEVMLFTDMGQQHHVVTLALTDWTDTPSPEATRCA